MASKCISKLAQSRPPGASLSSLDLGKQVHLYTHSITASKCISQFTPFRSPTASSHSLDHNIQLHVQTRSITAYKFTRSWPPLVHLPLHLITASKCGSNYGQLPPASPSQKSLDHSLGVNLWVHSIAISRRTSNCSQALPATSPDLPCVDR